MCFMVLKYGITLEMTQVKKNIYIYTPFLFFRLFDICKPWPINVVDKNDHSANGVMLDDVMAAFYAAASSIIVFLVLEFQA